MRKVQILITIRGGCIESAIANSPVQLHVIDKDNGAVGEPMLEEHEVTTRTNAQIRAEMEGAK